MTTDALVSLLAERGLKLVAAGNGPVLRGPKEAATPALLRVVQIHRAALAAEAAKNPIVLPPAREVEPERPATGRQREYLWDDGHTYRERPCDAHVPLIYTADWWRYVGEVRWNRIPKEARAA